MAEERISVKKPVHKGDSSLSQLFFVERFAIFVLIVLPQYTWCSVFCLAFTNLITIISSFFPFVEIDINPIEYDSILFWIERVAAVYLAFHYYNPYYWHIAVGIFAITNVIFAMEYFTKSEREICPNLRETNKGEELVKEKTDKNSDSRTTEEDIKTVERTLFWFERLAIFVIIFIPGLSLPFTFFFCLSNLLLQFCFNCRLHIIPSQMEHDDMFRIERAAMALLGLYYTDKSLYCWFIVVVLFILSNAGYILNLIKAKLQQITFVLKGALKIIISLCSIIIGPGPNEIDKDEESLKGKTEAEDEPSQANQEVADKESNKWEEELVEAIEEDTNEKGSSKGNEIQDDLGSATSAISKNETDEELDMEEVVVDEGNDELPCFENDESWGLELEDHPDNLSWKYFFNRMEDSKSSSKGSKIVDDLSSPVSKTETDEELVMKYFSVVDEGNDEELDMKYFSVVDEGNDELPCFENDESRGLELDHPDNLSWKYFFNRMEDSNESSNKGSKIEDDLSSTVNKTETNQELDINEDAVDKGNDDLSSTIRKPETDEELNMNAVAEDKGNVDLSSTIRKPETDELDCLEADEDLETEKNSGGQELEEEDNLISFLNEIKDICPEKLIRDRIEGYAQAHLKLMELRDKLVKNLLETIVDRHVRYHDKLKEQKNTVAAKDKAYEEDKQMWKEERNCLIAILNAATEASERNLHDYEEDRRKWGEEKNSLEQEKNTLNLKLCAANATSQVYQFLLRNEGCY